MKNKVIITNDTWYADFSAVQESLKDASAWEKLYHNSHSYVRNYVAKRFKAEFMGCNTIDDVLAETYERCYFDRGYFRGESSFSTWVCAYARYVMLNMMSRSACYQRHITERCTEELADKINFSPLWHLEKNERDRFIWMAYDSLSYEHQKMLDCYILNEITPTEAGMLTGLGRNKRKEELEIAVDVLRKRYLSLYSDDDCSCLN